MTGDETTDDAPIADAEILIRAVPPSQWVRNLDDGRLRPTSGAFSESSDGSGMSVNLESVLRRHGLARTFVASALAERRQGWGFVGFPVSEVRRQGCRVERAPEPDNPAHAAVFDVRKQTRRYLSRVCEVISAGSAAAS